MGAYLQLVTPGIPLLGAWIYNGPYDIPNYSVTFTGVFTHTTPTDAYRGAGRPEATYVIERTMDALARELEHRPGGASPQELHHGVPGPARLGPDDRLRRLPRLARPAAGAPRPRLDPEGAGGTARARGREAARRRLLDLQRDVRPRPVSNPRSDPLRRRRLGLAPRSASSRSVRCRSSRGRRRTGRAMRPPGRRSSPTSWACRSTTSRCCTATRPYPSSGWTRTAAARSQWAGSRSCMRARRSSTRRGRSRGTSSRCRATTSSSSNGTFRVKGSPDREMTIQAAAFQAHAAHNLPDGMEPGLEATATYDPPNFSWPAGAHAAVVEVDIETGDTRLVRYVAVDDVGAPGQPDDHRRPGARLESRRGSPPRSTRRASTTRTGTWRRRR